MRTSPRVSRHGGGTRREGSSAAYVSVVGYSGMKGKRVCCRYRGSRRAEEKRRSRQANRCWSAPWRWRYSSVVYRINAGGESGVFAECVVYAQAGEQARADGRV